MTITIIKTTDITACLLLRRKVFIQEQGVCEEDEIDDLDAEAIHLLAVDGSRAVGTARLVVSSRVGKVGRVCVLPEFRGAGLGAQLILAALDQLRNDPLVHVARLGAQVHALGFYERLGFIATGPIYDDAGIPHRDMECPL